MVVLDHGADEDEYYDLLEEGHGTVRDDKNYDDGYHTAGVGELGPLVIKLPLPPGEPRGIGHLFASGNSFTSSICPRARLP